MAWAFGLRTDICQKIRTCSIRPLWNTLDTPFSSCAMNLSHLHCVTPDSIDRPCPRRYRAVRSDPANKKGMGTQRHARIRWAIRAAGPCGVCGRDRRGLRMMRWKLTAADGSASHLQSCAAVSCKVSGSYLRGWYDSCFCIPTRAQAGWVSGKTAPRTFHPRTPTAGSTAWQPLPRRLALTGNKKGVPP